MATQLKEVRDTRSNRLVVLLSNQEKRAIDAAALNAGMSLSDYVRTAAQNYSEPSESEKLMMQEMLDQLEASSARVDASLARAEALAARDAEFDEQAYKQRMRDELMADGDVDWAAVADMLDLGPNR